MRITDNKDRLQDNLGKLEQNNKSREQIRILLEWDPQVDWILTDNKHSKGNSEQVLTINFQTISRALTNKALLSYLHTKRTNLEDQYQDKVNSKCQMIYQIWNLFQWWNLNLLLKDQITKMLIRDNPIIKGAIINQEELVRLEQDQQS